VNYVYANRYEDSISNRVSIVPFLWYSNAIVVFPEFHSNDFPSRVGKRQSIFTLGSCSKTVHCLFTLTMSRSDILSKLYVSLLDARNKARNGMKNKRRQMIRERKRESDRAISKRCDLLVKEPGKLHILRLI